MPPNKLLAAPLLALVLAACDTASTSFTSTNSLDTPGTPIITNFSAADGQVEVNWSKSSGPDGSNWRLFNNNINVCEESLVASADGSQSGGCSVHLVEGDNQLYVRLCNFHSSGSSACSNSSLYTHNYQPADQSDLPPGAIILEELSSPTYEPQLYVAWSKASGVNGDYWNIYHNGFIACTGVLISSADQQPQSAGCDVELDLGDNELYAELCVDKPVGIEDLCSLSPTASVTLDYDPANTLAQPVLAALAANVVVGSTDVAWSKDTSAGSAGESWSLYHNDAEVCTGELAAGATEAFCPVDIVLGANDLQVELCTDSYTYTGVSCTLSEKLSVVGVYPSAVEPGAIDLRTSYLSETYEDTVSARWAIDSGNGVQSWMVLVNGSSYCAVDAVGEYQYEGECDQVGLDLGANTISVYGCNYGLDGSEACAYSDSKSVQRLELPGQATIINLAASSYSDELQLDWERTSGASAETWLALVNDEIACPQADLSSDTGTQSGSCAINLASGDNSVVVRLCVADSQAASYCTDSEAGSVELLAPVPGTAVITTANQSVDTPTILLTWEKTSGETARTWQLYNNSVAVANCSGLPEGSGTQQQGSCTLALEAGTNQARVTLCNTNSAGTNSCSNSDSVIIERELSFPEFTSVSSVGVQENTSSSFYTASASDADSTDLSFGVIGGVDRQLFGIDSSSGALSFSLAPDFEAPLDNDGDNVYELTLEVRDEYQNSDSLALQVSVSDLDDTAPTFTSAAAVTISENSAGVIYLASASDPDSASSSYTLSGVDSAHFSIDSTSGELSPAIVLDFESPQDSNQDNTYELGLTATDPAANSSELSLSITVSGEYDEPPAVGSATQTVDLLMADLSTGSVFYTVAASDADAGDQLTYTLGGVDADHFNLDSASGDLSFTTLPNAAEAQDANGDQIYETEVSIQDLGANVSSFDLNISVDIGTTPGFSSDSASVVYAENSTEPVYTAFATDADGDAITYSLGGADAALFTIDASSGELSFNAVPDYEQPQDANQDNNYTLSIFARDPLGNESQQSLEVAVANLNDNSPGFASTSQALSVVENTSAVVYTAAATDADGDTLAYSLTGADSALFTLDSTSGELSFATPPDYENPLDQDQDHSYQVEISASDGGYSAALALSITVTNANDNSPGFALDSDAIAVEEGISGTIYTAVASDADGDAITYSLAGADSALFTIGTTSGELGFIAAPDFETPLDAGQDNTYELDIQAFDGTNTTTLALSIAVTNLNDNTPGFASASESIPVAENTSGVVYTAAATDADEDSLSYSLAGVDSARFTLDSSSGELRFIAAPDFENPLDGDADNAYELEISASDGADSATLMLSVVVADANDNAPGFASASDSVQVNEDIGGVIYTAAATDLDAIDTLAYSLAGADADSFGIDSSSGELSFITPPDYENPLDADSDNVYELTIDASDGVNHDSLALVVEVIDLNDNAPRFSLSTDSVSVPENSSGTIYTAVAIDADDGVLSYSLAGADADLFSIGINSGELSFIAAPDFEAPLDADTDNSYEVEISASDGVDSATLPLSVVVADANDNAPGFALDSDAIAVEEGISGTIYTAVATDPDVTAILTYSLTGTDSSLFSVNSTSGELSFATPPDFETPLDQGADNTYELTIQASDGVNSVSLELSVAVEGINDNSPEFVTNSDSITVEEDASGTIYTATATDLDGDSLRYGLSGTDSSLFAVNANNGVVSFANPPDFENPLDQGGDNTYELEVEASDGTNSSSLALVVTVADINDNPPGFALTNDSVAVAENSGGTIYTATATDLDATDSLTYSLAGTDYSYFAVDSSSGALSFKNSPDFEKPLDDNSDNTYELEIGASDGANTATLTLAVAVQNLNDNAPDFGRDSFSLSTAENSSSTIYTAAASDADGDSLAYSLAGTDSSLFAIDSASGELSFATPPDFEGAEDSNADNTYELTIQASDGEQSAALAFQVSVTDLNDESPQITSFASLALSIFDITLYEVIYTVAATDADAGDQLSYALSGADASHFQLGSSSGELSFIQSPSSTSPRDADANNVYEISITVSDSASNSSSIDLRITLDTDIGNPPVFDLVHDQVTISENSSGVFYTAFATDPEGNVVTFGLLGTDASYFSIDSVSGELSLEDPLDYEQPRDSGRDNNYTLTILASDHIGNQAQQGLDVLVSNVNDNAPEFALLSDTATVAENSTGLIYTASASDADGDALTYSLGGTDAALFDIGSSSGELFFYAAPDYEQALDSDQDNSYNLTITATDGASSAELALTVTVDNLNDTAPQFELSSDSFDVVENSTVVTTIVANDVDGDDLTFALVSSADSSWFSLDPSNGVLAFASAPDFETPADDDSNNAYQLELSVFDGSYTTSAAVTVMVTDLDEAPSFAAATLNLSIGENNDSIIYTAAASDPEQAALSYSASGADAGLFNLNTTSGELSFITAPDYEAPLDQGANNTYQLDITASDGEHEASQSLSITITDVNEAPGFATASVDLSTEENDASFAYTAEAATDPDQNEQLSYQLSGTDETAFSFDANTRTLSFATTPDYENPADQDQANDYEVSIIASDGEYQSTQTISISVGDLNDESPLFTSPSSQAVDYTTVKIGDVVYTAQATDADSGDQVSYTLGGADASDFDLDSASGALVFNQLPSFEEFLASGGVTYQLTITGTDLASNSNDLSLTINLVDDTGNPPEFSQASVSINVDENTASSVYTAQATDSDPGDTLTYSIAGIDADLFTIDPSSGELSFNTAPDYEQPADNGKDNTYELSVAATDGIGKQAQQSLEITVNNLNDNHPQFNLASDAFSVAENTTAVTTVAASDADGDDFTFALVNTADSNLFSLDSSSGALSFNSAPDFEAPLDAGTDNTYELELSVFDGDYTTTQEITIAVTNIDEAPSFTAASESLSVSENTSGSIHTASATDPEQATLTYSASGTDASLFTLDSSSGELSFTSAPDYETPLDADADNVYQLDLSASDGALTSSQALSITITNVNEPHSFASTSVNLLTDENNLSFAYVVEAAADEDQNQQLTYQLGGTDQAAFDFDASTRTLSFKANPDFETPADADGQNDYQVSITAADADYSASQDIAISVADVNDEAPRFTSLSSQAVDYTEVSVGEIIYTATATDADAGDQISFTLGGADASYFIFNGSNGWLAFNQLPDLEDVPEDTGIAYELTITATDLANNSSVLDLTIRLVDDTGSSPEFDQASADIAVDENTADSFYTAVATDVDVGDTLTYSLTGIDADHFTIDPSGGQLAFNSAPDFEAPADYGANNVYELSIAATDSIGKQAQQSLTITVINLNDNSPQFDLTSDSFDISENTTAVTTIAATDGDGDDLSFALISTTDSNLFTIDPASGALAFTSAPDFENPADNNSDNTYELELNVFDGSHTTTESVSVTVTNVDEAPSFASANESLSVSENTGDAVYQAQATDPEQATLSYSASGTDAGLFDLDSASGVLSFKATPDFEAPIDSGADNVYELSITASDGTNQVSQSLAITVTNVNEAPAFASASVNLNTDENAADFAHTVEAATDPDQGETLTYQLGGDDAAAFDFDAATRVLSFKATPDYESPADQGTNNVYQVTITAADAEYSTTQAITITVADLNDEAPQFTSLNLQTVDYTMVKVGDIVYTAQASDADANDQITYTLGGADAANFDFDPSSGELSFNQLPELEDFPQNGGIDYQLNITATDLAANSTDLALTISLLDDTGTAPTFASASATVNIDENSAGNIYTAQASDVDAGDTLTYSISGTDSSLFTIGSSSGELSFKTAPDYENPSDNGKDNTYDLTITATDSMAKQANQSLAITILNLNDNAPQFDLSANSFDVAENTTAITTVAADDVDGDDLTFSLTNSTDASFFSLDSTSGVLAFASAPDFENPADNNADNTYELELSVADGAYTTSATISVSVTNVNDVAPSFAATTDSSSVSENTSGVVYTASATDIEGDTLTYSLGGTDSTHFTIDSSNGELSLTNALDFENPTDHNSNNDYELEITASDGTNSAALALTVSVQDLNDNTPSFSSASDSIQIAENTSGTIYTASATDLDATDTITYTLSGTDSSLLQIDSSSGALAFINSPDYENPQDQGADNFYELSIVASDGTNSASLALSIEILDTSERPPEISQIIGGDQAIDFTFDDFGTSKQLSIYRFTDDACSTAELASDHTQCYASDDTSGDTARLDFSGALSSADYQVNDSGLRAGQRYYYQIWAAESSSASDIGVWSVRYSAMTWPAADLGTTLSYDASATGGTQVVLSFTAPSSGDDDYYHFLRHSDPDCSNYAAGTALNRADYSDWSALVDPVNGGLCSGLTELTLSGANLHAPSGGASDSHSDSGLAEGTTYYYLLRTVNYSGANGVDFSTRSGASATSNQLHWTTVPPAPAADDLQILSSPAVAADQISIAFASVAGASSYKLVRYIPANCSIADQQIASVESCSASDGYAEQDFNSAQSSYTDSGLQAGTTYAYQYRALNAAGSSQYSPAVSATTTTLDKPSISLTSSVSLADANVISVSWSASSGIDSYSVLGSSDETCLISATASADPQASAANCDHSISASATSSATSIDIDQLNDGSALASGSYYYFAAAAVSSSGSSDYSDVASAITAPASPNVISLSPGYQQVEVAWDVPAGSAENVLYRYTESTCSLSSFPSNCGLDTGSYTFTNSIPNDAYIDDNSGNGLVDNQMYYYALQASNAGGARYTESASVPVVLTAPKTPDSLIASGERLAVQLRWGSSPTDADDGVAGYEILRSSSSTCYGSAISAYSDYASCPDAALFLFDYGSGEDQNEYQFSDSELDPSSGSEPLTGGSTYYYWIRSFYGSTNDAVYSASTSAPASATPILPTPTNLTVDAELSGSSTDISIAWDEVASASGYVLYRTTSADCLTITNRNTSEAQNDCADYQREELSGSSTTATTHSSLPSDTIYYYYVAAANSAVEGELSSALSTRSATVAPTITTATPFSTTDVEVNWTSSSAYDATYHIYAYSGDSSCNPFTAGCPHESLTTINAVGSGKYQGFAQQLEPGTHYNFKMLAITEYEQEDGTEDFVHGAISSSAATATTAANHPTITGHEDVDYDNVELFASIEGGTDSVIYYVLYSWIDSCTVNMILGGQCVYVDNNGDTIALGGLYSSDNAYVTYYPGESIYVGLFDYNIYYYVISVNSTNGSMLGVSDDHPPYLVPARPAPVAFGVNATKNSSGNGTDIKIEWTQSSGVDGYVLYRTTSSGCITDANRNDSSTKSNCDDYQRQEISGSSTTTTTHSNLPNDTIYHYSLATISNGTEGALSDSLSTRTAASAPTITNLETYSRTQIEVNWQPSSSYDAVYYLYAYTGDASCDPHAEVCAGETLAAMYADGSSQYGGVISDLTPGMLYNFKIYTSTEYSQENDGVDSVVGYISDSAESTYTIANHPTITGYRENDSGDILLEFAIEGGSDDATYYVIRTTNGNCTITEAYNEFIYGSESKCTDIGGAYADSDQDLIILKEDDKDYYYHAYSENPAGGLAFDDSIDPYFIAGTVIVQNIDVDFAYYYDLSTHEYISLKMTAAESIPSNNAWTLRYYPAFVNNPEIITFELDDSYFDDAAYGWHIDTQYYFQSHMFEIVASKLDGGDAFIMASTLVRYIPPPPLHAVEKNADSNKYSEVRDFDIYIDVDDPSSIYGIDSLEAEITMIYSYAQSPYCRAPGFSEVGLIYQYCDYVRTFTTWDDQVATLTELQVGYETGAYDTAVSNQSYQADQELFEVHNFTFEGTKPKYDDQDDPLTYYVGPYISEFSIDTDGGKLEVDYSAVFSYMPMVLGTAAEFEIYKGSSSESLLPTPTLVLSPALLSQGLSAGSSYNSWDLHLLWEAINGINSYAIHEYSDSDCAYLLSAPELCSNYNLHSSFSPDFSHTFAAADMGSYFYYRLQAYDAAGNSSQLGEQIAVHIPQALNDSGLATCVVADALSGAQDCASGRDASVSASAKVGSGSAGFDFSLLETEAVADTSSDSHCVHDNTTGLSWSSWSVPADDLASAADPDTETNATRSSATFAELATISLDACGYSDWSLPSIHELLSIADYNQTDARIDRSIFTDFNSSQPSYWSASGHILDFSSGDISLEANASATHSVLLVRADRRWGHDFGAERFQLVEHLDGNLSIHLVYDNHSQLHYAPCLVGQSYDPINHSCLGTPTELDYIDSLNAYDSNSTWRQPNIKELIAILDPTHNLLPNPTYFPNPTTNSNPTSDPNSSTDSDSTSDSSTDSTSDTAYDYSTNPDSSTGSGSNLSASESSTVSSSANSGSSTGSNSSSGFSTNSSSNTASDSSTDSFSDSSTNSDSNSSASDSTNASYPAPIFILTPSSQSPDYITGRQLNPNTQSTTATTSFSTLNSYLIYQAPMEDPIATE